MIDVEQQEYMTCIGKRAYADCTLLTRLNIPDSVTWIGASAVQNCRSLTFIKIVNSLTLIPACLFDRCRQLKTVELPNEVRDIEFNAFWVMNVWKKSINLCF